MDPSTKKIILFMSVLTMGVVLAQSQGPLGGINEFCRTAIEKEMCTKQVKGAKTWHDAVKNAIQTTFDLNVAFQKMLPEVVNAIQGPSKSIIAKTCKTDFENIAINLKDSVGFFAQNDTGSVSSYLSSCNIIDCQDGFESSGSVFPAHVAKAFDELHWYIDNCLAVTNQN